MADATDNLRSLQINAAILDYLQAAERGAPLDREAFLVRHADIAAELGEFLTNQRVFGQAHRHRALNVPTEGHSVSTDGDLAAAPFANSQIIRAGTSSQLEIQTVLRKRLRFLALLFIASSVMGLVTVSLAYGFDSKLWGSMLAVEAIFAFCAWQCSRPMISLRALRWIEAGMFGFFMYSCAEQDFVFFQNGWYSRLAPFHHEGMAIAGGHLNFNWSFVIILYGLLIPNTARRCVAAVTLIVLTRLMVLAVIVHSVPDILPIDSATLLGSSAIAMCLVGVAAIFGAHRIESLRRTASEARKLGPYQLTKRLGFGGMGEVYLAQHALLRRPCALKLIRPDKVCDRDTMARFEREVQTMAALTHPNTVRVYDYGLTGDGTLYYSMEYLPGMSLQELVTVHGPLPPARAIYLLRQVCEALCEAHGAGLVHRDIKPANILACQIGGMHDMAKLLDFGLVRDRGFDSNDAPLTRAGTIAGTPAFMSPEQAAGATIIDGRSDIYSLGAVAYFLVVGRAPFVGATAVEIMAAHLTQQAVSPRGVCSAIPEDLDNVIVRCLAKEPADRFLHIEDLAAALARCGCANDWSAKQAANWWNTSGASAERPSEVASLTDMSGRSKSHTENMPRLAQD